MADAASTIAEKIEAAVAADTLRHRRTDTAKDF
jgi:hypothetical protein